MKCNINKPNNKFTINNYTEEKIDYWCKECRTKFVNSENTLKIYLFENQRPYDENLFKNCIAESEKKNKTKNIDDYNIIINNATKIYFQKMMLTFVGENGKQLTKQDLKNKPTSRKQTTKKKADENIDEELIIRWGKWEELNDYLILEDFCSRMKQYNRIETPQDEFYLKKLAVISLKMDKELEKGSYGAVKQLGDLFSKYMADSKFRATDLSDASKTGGIRTFSQIYAEVEKDGFIPPWEVYHNTKGLQQDIIDKTIMYILNYTLKLNKIPQMIEPPEDTPKIEDDFYES
jgi:hypothetical protein